MNITKKYQHETNQNHTKEQIMKKVLIINQGLTANIGDKAIKHVLCRFFNEKGFAVNFAGYASFEETLFIDKQYKTYSKIINTIKRLIPIVFKWLLKNKMKFKNHTNLYIDNYDLMIIGGGELIHTGNFPYVFKEWTKFSQRFSKKTVLLGVGINSYLSNLEKYIYNKYIKYYDYFLLRDHESIKRAALWFNIKSIFIPDVAFLLYKYINHKKEEKKEKNSVAIMPFDYNDYLFLGNSKIKESEYNQFWIKLIEQAISNNKKIKLMYTTSGDKIQTQKIENLLNEHKSDIKIINCDNLENFIEELQATEEVVSGRMHALILGMVTNCKVISVNVSAKIENFNKEYIQSNQTALEYCNEIEKTLNKMIDNL